jgi:hypothetical protein
MKRSGSIIIGVLLILAIIGAVIASHSKSGDASGSKTKATAKHLTAVKTVIGADKQVLFDDPAFTKRLRQLGFTYTYDKAGSREIATSYDLTPYDLAFPSSDTGAIRITKNHPKALRTPIFYSPMTIASFKPIAQLLAKQGIAKRDANGVWTLDTKAYLAATQKDLRWKDIPGNTDYPVNKSVLVSTADVRISNSGAMYLALLSYVANADNVVNAQTAVKAVEQVQPLFLKQGFVAPTNDAVFNTYLTQGEGAVPMGLIYESQFIERATLHDGSITPDMVLMYPSPGIFAQQQTVSLTDAGKAFTKALVNDPQLRTIEIHHGFRTPDTAAVKAFAAKAGVKVPAQIVDVVDTPDYDVLEGMIQTIEKSYKATNAG